MKSYTDKQLEQLSTMAWRMRREVEHDAAEMPALDPVLDALVVLGDNVAAERQRRHDAVRARWRFS